MVTPEDEDVLTSEQRLDYERELLGIYFSEHPLDAHKDKISTYKEVVPIAEVSLADNNKSVKLIGVITNIHKILTRKNDPMAFVMVEDKTSGTELIFFPNTLEKYQHLVVEGRVLYIKGKVNNKDNQLKILVDSVEDFKTKEVGEDKGSNTNFVQVGELSPAGEPVATIVIPDGATDSDLTMLKKILANHPGDTETFVVLSTNGVSKKIKMPFRIDFSNGITGDINALLSRRS